MKKYIVKLNSSLNNTIKTELKKANIFISYEPKLNSHMLFIETDQNKEQIMSFDWVIEVSETERYSLDI